MICFIGNFIELIFKIKGINAFVTRTGFTNSLIQWNVNPIGDHKFTNYLISRFIVKISKDDQAYVSYSTNLYPLDTCNLSSMLINVQIFK